MWITLFWILKEHYRNSDLGNSTLLNTIYRYHNHNEGYCCLDLLFNSFLLKVNWSYWFSPMQLNFVLAFPIHELLYWTYPERTMEIYSRSSSIILILKLDSYSQPCLWTNFGIWDSEHPVLQIPETTNSLSSELTSAYLCWSIYLRVFWRNIWNCHPRNWRGI